MAKKKSRTPPPPRPVRPVQAPKVRQDSRAGGLGPSNPGRKRLLAIGLVVTVIAIAVAAVLGIVLGGGSGSAQAVDGCVTKTFPSQGRNHLAKLKKGFTYNSFPPTSGPHYPTPAIWNIYTEPVPEIYLVHNLEHGGIVVQYGDKVQPSTVQQIADWYAKNTEAVLVAPLPALGKKVTLTAWTHLMTCQGFSQKAFDGFKDAHRFKGPQVVPRSSLQQGAA